MKKMLSVLVILSLAASACSKTDRKAGSDGKSGEPAMKTISTAAGKIVATGEKDVIGTWESTTVKGFLAEFNKDFTGKTVTPAPEHRGKPTGEPAEIPFKWKIENGKVKIMEGKKNSFYAQVKGKRLEVDMGGEKSVLEKVK